MDGFLGSERRWYPSRLVAVTILVLLRPSGVVAQEAAGAETLLLRYVMPTADSFSDKQGQPPVFRAYEEDPDTESTTLIGYVFLTSDLPPEERGYSGPIEVLVGMDLLGKLTGVKVIGYRESLRRSSGDFLSIPGFQEQFTGKHIADPFRVYRDVGGISRATITVAAMSRGIRNSARRVAEAYLTRAEEDAPDGPSSRPFSLEEFEGLSWPEMLAAGLVEQLTVVSSRNLVGVEFSFAYIGDESVGTILLGPSLFAEVRREAATRADSDHLMLLGLDGRYVQFFDPRALAIAQGLDTLPLFREDVVLFGTPREGKVDGQVESVGVLFVDRAVDLTRPFSILYDLRPEGGRLFSTEHSVSPGMLALTQELVVPEAVPPDRRVAASPVGRDSVGGPGSESTAPEPMLEVPELTLGVVPAEGATVSGPDEEETVGRSEQAPLSLGLTVSQEETVLSRTLARTSWTRVGWLVALLCLVAGAFFAKRANLRWVALSATVVFLGFVDGSFLSISHITSGIWVGWSVYLNDLSLLLMVVFTLVTTLVWGRVFCGFLCPFGALQDLLDRTVPRRFKRSMPSNAHRLGLNAKYAILALVVIPPLAGSHVSIYQYVEPFGTVFFFGSSALLWAIAMAFLVASVILPRFYCRYVCPLGAALALMSLISLKRIRRVEQCHHCKVCEQRCPTGAIHGAKIDFKECVRCNICEILLDDRSGVCRHQAADVRRQLVQLKVGSPQWSD